MGNAMKRRFPASLMPKEVEAVFEETDIERTWNYLHDNFKLNKKDWKKRFEEEFTVSSREFSKMELFVRFGKEHFESAICVLLNRDPYYSHTWIKLITYMVRDKVEEKRKEAEVNRNYYRYGK